MDPRIYSLIHVLSVILLTASVLYITADPQAYKKKKMMTINGILAVLALVGGFGLIAKYNYSYTAGWIIAKYVIWLFVSALAGMAYKKSKSFIILSLTIATGIALYMVYFRPF